MNTISIKGDTYYCHPIYDQYASNRSGQVIDIMNKRQQRGIAGGWGNYLFFEIEKELYPVHQFIYECFHGVQPGKKWLSTLTDSNWKKMWLPILMATREIIVSET